MAAPRWRGFRARFAGQEFGAGMEGVSGPAVASWLGQPMGAGPIGARPMGAASMGTVPMSAHLSGHGAGAAGTGLHPRMAHATAAVGYGPSGDMHRGGFFSPAVAGDDVLWLAHGCAGCRFPPAVDRRPPGSSRAAMRISCFPTPGRPPGRSTRWASAGLRASPTGFPRSPSIEELAQAIASGGRMRPLSMLPNTTSSATCAANPISWVTTTIVMPSLGSACTSPASFGASADVGSLRCPQISRS